jgi:nucleoside-diphosphate-sugar epimerase
MERVLITGAKGFIGQHLVRELEPYYEVIGVDRDDGNLLAPLRADAIICDERPDIVVHLAAKVGRQFGDEDPVATIMDNAGMTSLIAEACGAYSARLVYASTSEVYGDQGMKLCQEIISDHRGRVHNLYGLSKRWGEEAAELYAPEGLTILRLSMPYGPGLPWGRGRAAIINMLWQALTRSPIPVHVGAERSWCWVGDTVRGIRYAIESEGGVFNVGRDDASVSMERVAEIACDLTGADRDLIQFIHAPTNQTVVKRLSTWKLRKLGWAPKVDLHEGMERCLEWIKDEAIALEEVA